MAWEAGAALLAVAVPIALLYRPLGDYMTWVFTSPKHSRVERVICRVCGVDADAAQTSKAYLRALLALSLAGLATLCALQRLQPWLPHSLGLGPVDRALAFNRSLFRGQHQLAVLRSGVHDGLHGADGRADSPGVRQRRGKASASRWP